MKQLFATFVLLTGLIFSLNAQETATQRSTLPRDYATDNALAGEALQGFDALFPEQNIGFFHVYSKAEVDPMTTYLLEGAAMGNTQLALLPKKYQKIAERTNAEVYAAGAIRGLGEELYLVRMDGPQTDRIEMFAIRDNKVEHLKTLSYNQCRGSNCMILESWITDIDGNGDLDLMQIARNSRGREKRSAFVMDPDSREWKKTKNFTNVPWDSANPYDMKQYGY